MDGLEIYTTEQLIEELSSRNTWAGVIIHSTQAVKPPLESRHKNFVVRSVNIEWPEQVRDLLGMVLEEIPEAFS